MSHTEERCIVVSGHLVMLYDPDLPQEKWGFKEAGKPRVIDKPGRGGRFLQYHNSAYIFRNEAIVRFLVLEPATKRGGEIYYRIDDKGRKIQHIPYSIKAECEELGWVRMALLPTINFHEAIQRNFQERGIEDEEEVCHHLWRVFKGPRKGYNTGMWGIAYYRADYYQPLEGEDPRKPSENSPWNTVPRAMEMMGELKEKVLPHFPAKPSEAVYVREIMERLGTDYEVAKVLYDTRKEVGLP